MPGVVVLPIRFNSYYDSKKVSDIDVGLIHIYRDPLEIKRELQMSKKTFKKGVGTLYKARKIDIVENGIKAI